MTWEPFFTVIWAFFSCRSVDPPSFATTLEYCAYWRFSVNRALVAIASLLVMLSFLLIVIARIFLIYLWFWWVGTVLSRKTLPFAVWKIQPITASLPDQSQTISHDDSSSEGTACTSGRRFDPVATRVRSMLLSCLGSFQNPLAQVLNLHFLRIPYGTEMVRSLSQSFFEKTSIYPDSCLSDLVELWYETFDKTGDVPSLILPSSKLHIFLSLFHCRAYQESDTEPILWWCSGCDCWQSRRIFSMIMLHDIRVFLNTSSRKLSTWKNPDAHHLVYLVSMEQ